MKPLPQVGLSKFLHLLKTQLLFLPVQALATLILIVMQALTRVNGGMAGSEHEDLLIW